ncbi:MAG: S41 family peptidase [Coriobacteriales bacterium]|nr:S41 family peptidase [Coriobacteriales bacterium]
MSKRSHHSLLLAGLFVLALTLLIGCTAQPNNQASYVERSLKLISTVDNAPSELTVRFYNETPNVPYFGLAQYKELVLGDTCTVESDGKTITLTATDGGSITVDDAQDTISSNDLAAFRTYLAPQQQAGKSNGMLDLGSRFVRVGSIESKGPAHATTLDYGAYHIDLHVDDKDAYLPLACESDLLAVASCAALFYNGTNLYLTDRYTPDIEALDPNYYQQLQSNHERPQDMVDFTYNNLCFLMDKLAGNTKSDALGTLVAEVGFNKALDHDEATRKTRELLKSTDFYEFIAGTEYLYALTANGHTTLADAALMQNQAYLESESVKDGSIFNDLTKTDLVSSFAQRAGYGDDGSIIEQRQKVLGENPPTYREQGDTAVIILDSFMNYDADAWNEHYNSGAEIPTGDLVGTLIAGLKRAKQNPQIKYVILDISLNGGGYNELLATAEALVLNKPQLKLYDQLNQQNCMVNYEVDSLFDGSFAASTLTRDMDVTFAVLTSRNTFSCGNAFTEHCRDEGIPILGEPSLGGEYLVVPCFFPEGPVAQISAGTMKMVDASGSGNEEGVPVDVALDYADYYDMDRLSEVMRGLQNISPKEDVRDAA